MIKKICMGCGATLQSDDKNKEGYIPKEKLNTSGKLLCMRCFKLKNYGSKNDKELDYISYENEVKKAVVGADIVVPIFDIVDFESSFVETIQDILRDYRNLIVINKIDLLPKFMHPTEISDWVKKRLLEEDIVADDIAFVSAKNKYGVNGILRKIKVLSNTLFTNKKTKIKVVIIGVSNVGKSSIINLLLNKPSSTVSKYSGTTLKSISNLIKDKDAYINIVDTPGLIPQGRISDLLEDKTAIKLVPSGEISRKTFKLKENQIFMFSNLCHFKVLETPYFEKEDRYISSEITVYASKNIELHVTNEEKYEKFLENDFFKLMNEDEKKKYSENSFVEEEIEIPEGYDLSISGLGWLEVKRGPLKILLTYPEDVKIVLRKSLSSSVKRRKNEE